MRNLSFLFTLVIFAVGCKSSQPQTSASEDNQPKKSAYQKIADEAKLTDDGLFRVFRNGDKVHYEIPDSLLGKEMLLISRIAALPSGFGGGYINAGSKTNEQVVRWEKKHDKILLRTASYAAVASDSLPIQKSVVVNNYEPILYSFDIEASGPDGSSTVIRVDDLFTKDITAIGPIRSSLRKTYQVRRVDDKRSFIESVKSFPLNIEVRHDLTFEASNPPGNDETGSISIQMNQSMVLLPDEQMEKRPYDERVDWFTVSQIDYGSEELKADQKRYIRKWNLVPKDPEAYARGELVEPVKPIVYYLDPATPEKWRPYFREGIELWQKTFETAGFKNAIIAKDPPSPEEDPEFSPEDVRYSVVRYVASTTRNAVGPSVSDPRTGEIIESDIIWYHNHLRSYRNRYLLETGAANPRARTLDTPDADIGEMMKMVIAHEVGHALGLPHNMKASSAYPVDSLRSGSFTQKYGIASTIMDYARYNYVAQPGDENIRFIRQIGPYDHYAINWGYRYIDPETSEDEKKATLNSWIKEKEGDPMFMFGSGRGQYDPTSQTEGIGDDPVEATRYGIKNLRIVAENLVDWTTEDGENYGDLEELHGEMLGVWSRYTGHVVSMVGGVEEIRKTADQDGPVYSPVPAEDQQRAVKYLLEESFADPSWLVSPDLVRRISAQGTMDRIRSLQARHLRNLLSVQRISRMVENSAFNNTSYSADNLFREVQQGLWSELNNSRTISPYRRNLQRAHVEHLAALAYPEDSGNGPDASATDAQALARASLTNLKRQIGVSKNRMSDDMSRYHLEDIEMRINDLMNQD